MSEEYLEALKTIKIKCHPNSNPSPLVDEALKVVEQALQRLEQIDNAKPSEALERVIALFEGIDNYEKQTGRKNPPAYISRETLIELHHTLLKAYEDEEENKRLWNDIATVSKQYTDLMLDYQDQKRVLEIIKEKSIDVDFLKHVFKFNQKLEEYNNFVEEYQKLTQEEFELLKRWLG